jgi:heat shock protein HtpX
MNTALKSWSFLLVLSVTLIVCGHLALGRGGLLVGLVLALGMNCYVYFFEARRVVQSLGGRPVEGQEPWGVLPRLRSLAAKMRLPIPRVVILRTKSPQALVVGRSLTQGTVLVTEGLLEKLNNDEIEALLAYLLACMQNMNTLAFSVGSFLASTLLSLTGVLDAILRVLIVEKKNPNSRVSQFFTRLGAPLAGLLVRLSVRPGRYFDADRRAASVVESPQTVASLLWKLDSYSKTAPYTCPLPVSHMFVVNPLTASSWNRYFHAQPKVDRRILALVGHYPI